MVPRQIGTYLYQIAGWRNATKLTDQPGLDDRGAALKVDKRPLGEDVTEDPNPEEEQSEDAP